MEAEKVTLPAETDGVQLVESHSAFGDWDHVFALGLREGTLPKRRREDPLLPDPAIHALSKLGKWMPDSFDISLQDRDRFAQIVGCAGVRLALSYPMTGVEEDSVPTAYIEDLRASVVAAGGTWLQETIDRSLTFPPTSESCLALSDFRIREAFKATSGTNAST